MNTSLLHALRRRLWLLLVVPVLVGAVVALTAPGGDEAPSFRSSATIAYTPEDGATSDSAIRQAELLVREPVVAQRAATILGEEDGEVSTRRVSTEVDPDALTIRITGTGSTADEAREFTEAYAEAFVDVMTIRANEALLGESLRAEQAFESADEAYGVFLFENELALAQPAPDPALVERRDELFARRSEAEQEVDRVRRAAEVAATEFEAGSAAPAERPATGTFDLLEEAPVRGVAAAVVTLLALAALLAVLERITPRVTDRQHMEVLTGAPVLAMVPRVRGRATRDLRVTKATFRGAAAEAHRTLRVHLQFLARAASGVEPEPVDLLGVNGGAPLRPATGGAATAPPLTVAVVSPTPSDGKSTTVALLAMSFVESGVDTLVLSCDFRRPSIHHRFGLSASPGFTDRRGIEPTPSLADLITRDPETGVQFLPSGRPTPHYSGALDDARAVVRAASAAGRVVVLDTAPVLVASETAELAAVVDYVVLVVRAGKTTVRSVTEAVTTLRLNHTEITGVVMIGSPEATDYSYYYDDYEVAAAKPGRWGRDEPEDRAEVRAAPKASEATEKTATPARPTPRPRPGPRRPASETAR